MENSAEVLEDEYPIILYEPNCELASKINMKENKKVHLFCEFNEMMNFAQSLKMSFLMIFPDEELLFKDLNKDMYGRRLADFEEKAILQGIGVQDEAKVYVFYTDEDFESEVFVEEDAMKWDVEEAAKDFRVELIFWERKRRGLEVTEAVFEGFKKAKGSDVLEGICDLWKSEEEEEEGFPECKRFCIRSLKELVRKRKQEKKKLIYYVNLGECCFQLNEYEQALEYYTKACDIVEQIYGETHPNIGPLYEALFRIYRRMKNDEKSIEYGLKTIEIKKSISGETHEEIASLYQDVGMICRRSGQYERAIECFLKAVERKKAGASRPGVALGFLYSHIGDAFKDLKDFSKAIEYHQKSLEIKKSIYGETNSWTASSYSEIALMFQEFGDNQNAIEWFSKARTIYKFLPKENPSALYLLSIMSGVNDGLNDCQKAIERSVKIYDTNIA